MNRADMAEIDLHGHRCMDSTHDQCRHRQEDHPHASLAKAFHKKRSGSSNALASFLDKPVSACYNHFKLTKLERRLSISTTARTNLEVSTDKLSSDPLFVAIQEAFTALPDDAAATRNRHQQRRDRDRDQATTTSRVGARQKVVSGDTDNVPPRTKLDARFQIGFSKAYGHSVELKNITPSPTTSSNSKVSSKNAYLLNASRYNSRIKVESGTHVFEADELPYACVIEKAWRDKLCEECLRPLPSKRSEVVECSTCPGDLDAADGTRETTLQEDSQTAAMTAAAATMPSPSPSPSMSPSMSPSLSPALLPHTSSSSSSSLSVSSGRAKFCSQECLTAAWKSWHQYECAFAKELNGLEQRTRLALRVYWQNKRRGISIIPSLSPSSKEKDTMDSLVTKTMSSLSMSHTNSNNSSSSDMLPRVRNQDGSDMVASQLCHNFWQMDPMRRASFLMTGYYLQQLLDLQGSDSKNDDNDNDNEAAAVAEQEAVTVPVSWELAYLQAMVQFNSFAVKAQISEAYESHDTSSSSSLEEGTNMTRMGEYAIGSALYLLASMFNHSCAPNAMVVFGRDGRLSSQQDPGAPGPDPRAINVVTNRALKVDPDVPVLVEISYGPQGGRMATEERKECLRRSHLFECNCSACNDRYAEAVLKKIYKCPKNGHGCRPLGEKETTCPTCGVEIDVAERKKMHQVMARLIANSQDPSLQTSKRLTLLQELESAQSSVFVDTCILYGNTCDQLAMVYAQSGDLNQSIEWCKRALKVVVVHFPHDSIEVAQETLKLAGLYFNNMQAKEAMRHVQIAITLYKGHYGAQSRHPDLLELYEMEKILRPLV
ncbi:hypothetical protein B0O80DRAFT_529589 [Mortierella sp. GBAus27b]|nr:SET and MYND domain-containing protein 4 [Mortierella sp. GBA43]KAI8353450.1 hypothetical protein B0O80DRAFT_529589 [Mortierella sp. GBAus27b]